VTSRTPCDVSREPAASTEAESEPGLLAYARTSDGQRCWKSAKRYRGYLGAAGIGVGRSWKQRWASTVGDRAWEWKK